MYYFLIFLAIITWGVWAFLGKVAADYNNATVVTLGTNIGYFLFSLPLFFLLFKKDGSIGKIDFSFSAVWPVIAVAILGVAAKWIFYSAFERGPGTPVVALTALYPVVSTLLLFFILGERVSKNQVAGLVIICLGMMVFLWDKESTSETPEDDTNSEQASASQ